MEEKMIEIEYKGEIYKRLEGQWVDSSFIVATVPIQRTLNQLYVDSINVKLLDIDTLIKEGDSFKSTGDYSLAIRFYEEAIKTCDRGTIIYLLPRISSCYRGNQAPQKAIECFSFAKRKYGTDILSPALLTSAAAAYCDLKEYESAIKCAKIAFAKSEGKADESLLNVFSRIDKESVKRW